MRAKFLGIIIFVCEAALGLQAQQIKNSDVIIGQWLMVEEGGNDTLEIFKENRKYYGKLVGIGKPLNQQGESRIDENNPDDQLRNHPLLGIVTLKDLIYYRGNVWVDGKMYYPKNGKEYRCKITLIDNNEIEARYYVGFSLLGVTENWTRIR